MRGNIFLFIVMAISVAMINVNGLCKFNKHSFLFEYFTCLKTCIVIMQETLSIKNDESMWKKEWEGETAFSHGDRNSRGVAILISGKSGINILDN